MVSLPKPRPIDPPSAAFLLAESKNQPMHVGGLQLYEKPADAGPDFVRELFEAATSSDDEIMPLFRKHPYRSVRTAGQLFWREDEQFDIEHHVRHNALPSPAGSASCSTSVAACTAPGSTGSDRSGRRT